MMLNRIKNISLLIFFIIASFYLFESFDSKTILNISRNINEYQVQLTYYYPGDATGSTTNLGASSKLGISMSDLTLDEKGWYHYIKEGVDYLVIAAATTYCRDAANHCGVDVSSHGMATSIPYYNYGDVVDLTIDNTSYKAMVLDSCGACMWGKQDTLGEKFDIFSNPGAVNPGIYLANKIGGLINNIVNPSLPNINNTTYEGDIRKGYIYEKQLGNSITKLESENDEPLLNKINSIINNIITNAGQYISNSFEILISGDETEAKNWRQTSSSWGNISLGNSKWNISNAGCLATSVAIQMQLSGTTINSDSFNPGTFVQYLNQHDGFTSGGLFKWDNNIWSGLAPNFVVANSSYNLPASKNAKIQKIGELLNQGYYPVMCVKKECGHWVAVTGVSSDNINIIDPGSNATQAFPTYTGSNVTRVALFKKLD